MIFLADMGISQKTIRWLRDQEYNVTHLRELNLQKEIDKNIFELALDENRIVLTFDLDFAEILAASGEKAPSVIIFRLKNAKPENVNKCLAKVLQDSAEALEEGSIISVTDHRHRVRRLPIS